MARNTEFVILGMLQLGEMSGYQIRQEIKQSIGAFWSESDGQLYPALKRLVQEQQIEPVESIGGSLREKKLYRITACGVQRLQQWLAQPVVTNSVRNEFCLKVFFAANADTSVIRDLIQQERYALNRSLHSMAAAMDEIQDVKDASVEGHKRYWEATARYGQYVVEAKLRWCDEMLSLLAQEESG